MASTNEFSGSIPNGTASKSKLQHNPDVDYTKNITKFSAARYVIEVCTKLDTHVLTTATALSYFHSFYLHSTFEDFDPFTIGCTCIHLASKVADDDIRIRDIINVGFCCIKRDAEPLMLEPYFTLRDSLTQAELLVMRVLGFKLKLDLPHKYLLHYLRAVEDWVGRQVTDKIPVNETSWQILQDAYHDDIVVKTNPEALAATCLSIALEMFGIVVPHELETPWYSILHESCTKETVSCLSLKILSLYEKDAQLTLVKS